MADEIMVDVDAVISSGADFEVSLLVKKPTTPAHVELTVKVDGSLRPFELQVGGISLPLNTVQKITIAAVIDWTVANWGSATHGQQVLVEAKEVGGSRVGHDTGIVV